MRYKYIANPGSGMPVYAKPIITVEGNVATVHTISNGYYNELLNIVYRDSVSGLCITKHHKLSPVTSRESIVYCMLIPESHPLFNYGILLEELKFNIKLGAEVKILDSVTALYKEIEQHINK